MLSIIISLFLFFKAALEWPASFNLTKLFLKNSYLESAIILTSYHNFKNLLT